MFAVDDDDDDDDDDDNDAEEEFRRTKPREAAKVEISSRRVSISLSR